MNLIKKNMICLYYSPGTQCYDIAYEHDLIDQLREGIVFVLEPFDAQEPAHRQSHL